MTVDSVAVKGPGPVGAVVEGGRVVGAAVGGVPPPVEAGADSGVEVPAGVVIGATVIGATGVLGWAGAAPVAPDEQAQMTKGDPNRTAAHR